MLTAEQVTLGAMHLATSNLAQPTDPTDANSVKDAWQRCVHVHACDGIEVQSELLSWKEDLRNGDTYSVNAVKKELSFLFT